MDMDAQQRPAKRRCSSILRLNFFTRDDREADIERPKRRVSFADNFQMKKYDKNETGLFGDIETIPVVLTDRVSPVTAQDKEEGKYLHLSQLGNTVNISINHWNLSLEEDASRFPDQQPMEEATFLTQGVYFDATDRHNKTIVGEVDMSMSQLLSEDDSENNSPFRLANTTTLDVSMDLETSSSTSSPLKENFKNQPRFPEEVFSTPVEDSPSGVDMSLESQTSTSENVTDHQNTVAKDQSAENLRFSMGGNLTGNSEAGFPFFDSPLAGNPIDFDPEHVEDMDISPTKSMRQQEVTFNHSNLEENVDMDMSSRAEAPSFLAVSVFCQQTARRRTKTAVSVETEEAVVFQSSSPNMSVMMEESRRFDDSPSFLKIINELSDKTILASPTTDSSMDMNSDSSMIGTEVKSEVKDSPLHSATSTPNLSVDMSLDSSESEPKISSLLPENGNLILNVSHEKLDKETAEKPLDSATSSPVEQDSANQLANMTTMDVPMDLVTSFSGLANQDSENQPKFPVKVCSSPVDGSSLSVAMSLDSQTFTHENIDHRNPIRHNDLSVVEDQPSLDVSTKSEAPAENLPIAVAKAVEFISEATAAEIPPPASETAVDQSILLAERGIMDVTNMTMNLCRTNFTMYGSMMEEEKTEIEEEDAPKIVSKKRKLRIGDYLKMYDVEKSSVDLDEDLEASTGSALAPLANECPDAKRRRILDQTTFLPNDSSVVEDQPSLDLSTGAHQIELLQLRNAILTNLQQLEELARKDDEELPAENSLTETSANLDSSPVVKNEDIKQNVGDDLDVTTVNARLLEDTVYVPANLDETVVDRTMVEEKNEFVQLIHGQLLRLIGTAYVHPDGIGKWSLSISGPRSVVVVALRIPLSVASVEDAMTKVELTAKVVVGPSSQRSLDKAIAVVPRTREFLPKLIAAVREVMEIDDAVARPRPTRPGPPPPLRLGSQFSAA